MNSDTDDDSWRRRELLFRQAMKDKNLLYKTYSRYYRAHHITTKAGWISTGLTAIIGAVLLYVITSATFNLPVISGYLQGTDDVLAILLLIVSLIDAFYSPEARSIRYYRAGQDLQELHDEYENFVNLAIADPGRNIDMLAEEFEQLHKRRHSLNKSVPQLSGIWHSMVKMDQHGYRTLIPFVPSKQELSVRSLIESKLSSENEGRSSPKKQWEETLSEKVNGFKQKETVNQN
ncbi:hypothetical protein ACFO5R_14170 [Halosolutus amylolyticus]|uniref:SMODS and SLOG-associating 2TM effector domain-containing protein n=1 Tax=Halosolutus amylolyticus TaxID=2932267 RepID=A0ABD5PRF1_9EURY|nr:hypothetical protein [Halosolutus amylolyticus]